MYEIYATDLVREQCQEDKKPVNTLSPCAVLHFVLSGEGIINGKRVGAHTLFAALESCRMHYYPIRENPWCYVYLRLSGRELWKAFEDCGFSSGVSLREFHKEEELLHLLSLFQSLGREPEGGRLIANMALLLLREGTSPRSHSSKPLEHWKPMKRYLEENYHKRITVEGMAKRFYLNKNYVCSLFRQYLGLSPKQYLQKLRLERAQALLLSTDEDVKLIAHSVGYEDALLFSKVFKSRYGCSPLHFREAARGEDEP